MLLKTRKLSFSFSHKIICDHLDLEVYPGDMWGILGCNGSGKSTLLHTLSGLRRDFSGEIFLQGMPIQNIPRKKIAQRLGILFQETQFVFPQTVFEYCESSRYPHGKNILLDEKIIQEALTVMELDKLARQNVLTLSGGEKRRLMIAALLTQAPQIYLLDEPTNHLDVRHQLQVMQHFKNLAEKKPVGIMMALHDLQLAKNFCNKILMIFENGETLQGETADIFTEKNLGALYGCSVILPSLLPFPTEKALLNN